MTSSPGARATGTPLLLALAVGLILADSSVVTLALADILREFDSVVNDVAWVLISFNLALALVALPAARLARGRARSAFTVSMLAFAAASLACAAAPSLLVLVAARALQGLFGAVAVAAALELLVVSAGRDRAIGLWAAAGVLGAAVGPALGGFLTEALSWQAMFFLQAPVALLTLLGMRGVVRSDGPAAGGAAAGGRPAVMPLISLALAAAALSAALFLLVIMLIEGWRHSPVEAALTVTAMPLAALVAGRWASGQGSLVPAIAGALLVAGGLAALGLLPGAHAYWTFVPQLAIGAGLGLALATLIAASVGDAGAGTASAGAAADAVSGPAAWTVAARHTGIVLGLLALTPIFTADLETVREPAERAGLARVLDAPLGLTTKIALARRLDAQIEAAADQELPDLDKGFAGLDAQASERPAIAALRAGLGEELDRGATEAFSRSFLAAALLALLAAAAGAVAASSARGAGAGGASSNGREPGARSTLAVFVPGAGAIAALVVAGYVALGGGGYAPTPAADPCDARVRPQVERSQLIALALLDGASCKLGDYREDVLRSLLDGELPPGVDDQRLEDALAAGVDRAQEEGQLGGLAAAGLRFALSTAGTLGIIGLLLGEG